MTCPPNGWNTVGIGPGDPERKRPDGSGNGSKSAPPSRSAQQKKNADLEWKRYLGLVYELFAYLLVLGYVGMEIDRRKGWNGKGLACGLLLGLAAWTYRVLKVTKSI